MSWERGEIFASAPLTQIRIREFVEQAMRVPAHLRSLKIDIPVTLFPETNVYTQALICVCSEETISSDALSSF